jgi:uncharacterized protein
MRRYFLWATVSCFAATSLVAGLRATARAYTFPTSRVLRTPPPEDFEHYTLIAEDGQIVHAIGLPAAAGARTVVYFHNNRETASARAAVARALHAEGLGVLLVEYRGYGDSRAGKPTERGLYDDAECALRMLARKGTGADRIVLWGTSLGTGVAAEMARRGRGARLVLETPYTSLPDLVTDVLPLVPAGLLVPDHFDTLAKADGIRVPTLVIHGDADEIVPFSMGARVAEAIRGAMLLRIPGGHHGDLFAREGARLVRAIVAISS